MSNKISARKQNALHFIDMSYGDYWRAALEFSWETTTLDTPLLQTSLSTRARHVCHWAGLVTIRDLLNANSRLLVRTRSCGPMVRKELWLFVQEFQEKCQ